MYNANAEMAMLSSVEPTVQHRDLSDYCSDFRYLLCSSIMVMQQDQFIFNKPTFPSLSTPRQVGQQQYSRVHLHKALLFLPWSSSLSGDHLLQIPQKLLCGKIYSHLISCLRSARACSGTKFKCKKMRPMIFSS